MCGFVAIFNQLETEQLSVSNLLNVLHHRGPDAQGSFVSDDKKVVMFHNRLSFQDLSENSNQPFVSSNGHFVLVFNGEIYNFLVLKEQLLSKGYIFSTESDTEVILKGFEDEGIAFFKRMEGMFSCVIYDQVNKTMTAVRDRFGIKPLYYFKSENKLIFASEIKGIIAAIAPFKLNIRKESISLFLANRYVPTPFTIWENVYKLPPANCIVFDQNFNYETSTYWKIIPQNRVLKHNEIIETAKELLVDSVKNHLISDVPVGGFLSGGFDSSALAVFAKNQSAFPFDTFSIGFENWGESEDKFAAIVADKLDIPLHVKLAPEIDLEIVHKLMYHYDDPIADISIIPTYEVSKLASNHVKAVLSGEGADELFGGYWWNKNESFYFSSPFRRVSSTLFGKKFSDVKQHYIHAMSMGLFDAKELSEALVGDFQAAIPSDPFKHFDAFEMHGEPTVKQLQILDINTFMSELVLQKIDRATMANSLEARVPFLDTQLVTFMMDLAPSTYMEKGVQKPILRKILEPHVPRTILERKKQGFVGPDSFYMDIEKYEKALLDGRLVKDGVIAQEYIKKKIKEKDHWRLWKLFVLEAWWLNWMN